MTVRVGIGPGLGSHLSPGDYWRWVAYCEDAGIDSIWHSDQVLGTTLEPLTMLGGLAARTNRMRFGTNALVIAFRDPVVVAKELATIDFVSNGRLLPVFGVGASSDPYWAATGIASAGRGSRADEAIALIRLLLEQEQVEFEGVHYRYRGPAMQPRPRKPIPLWIGGNSQAAVRRTARFGDGWLGSLIGPGQAGELRLKIEAELAEAGRSIDADHYGVTLFVRLGAPDDPALTAARDRLLALLARPGGNVDETAFAVGTPDDVVHQLRAYVAAGMSKFVVLPMTEGIEDLMVQTDWLVRDVLPEVEDTAGR